jgi:putative oxidoreductase
MIPERYASTIYAIVRIVFGFLFLVHGLQKLFGMFDGTVVPLGSLLGVAAMVELVGGILIIIGLFTRLAAFIASGEMAAAYFIAHLPQAFWPVQNGGESAVLFCFVFLYIAVRGAGSLSVDGLRSKT